MVPLTVEIATTKGISFIFLNWFFIKLGQRLNPSFSLSSTGVATGSEAITSSHIEEMIQELAQQEGLEIPSFGMPHEGATAEIGEPSSPSGLSKDLSSSGPQLSKRIKICHILFFILSLTLILWLQRVLGELK